MLLIFPTLVLIRHLWQLEIVVFLHWRLILAVLLVQVVVADLFMSSDVSDAIAKTSLEKLKDLDLRCRCH